MSVREGEKGNRFNLFSSLSDRSALFIFYAAFFILASIVAWGVLGYTDFYALISIWALLILSFIYLVYAVALSHRSNLIEKLPFVSLALSLWLFMLISKMFYPAALHDEITIDSYAAYLFLHHVDPYVASNMVNVFSYFHFPLDHGTPLRAGGYVYYLIYPALSVYAFVPVIALGIPNYWIPLLFNIATFILLVYYYRRRNFTAGIPLIAVLVFVEAELLAGAITGETDVIWVFFLALSYIFRKKPWFAGLFFGLSIAQKQIPIVIAPFLLYLIYRENDRNKSALFKPVVSAGLIFVILNAPFIVMNPGAWFSSMLLSVEQPIIGVGIGFGILSFAGYAPVPAIIFSDLLMTSLAFFFVLYIRYFSSVKYAFFAFPIIIFLFNFRSLENYLIYWPLLTMLVLPDFLTEHREKDAGDEKSHAKGKKTPFFSEKKGLLTKSNFTAFLILVIILGGGVSTGYVYHEKSALKEELQITGVSNFSDPIMVDSSISAMTVNITYSPMENSIATIPVYFRVMPNEPIQSNINALLWSAKNPYVKQGNNSVTIYPDFSTDLLPSNTSFIIEAYYANLTAFYKTQSPILASPPIQDPFLLYPTQNEENPFPGWNLTETGTTGALSYSSDHLSLEVGPSSAGSVKWRSVSVSTQLNFSYLSSENYSLSYSFNGRNGTLVGSQGNILRFEGILLTFNSGQEKFWYGYNASATGSRYWSYNRVNVTMISPYAVLNFRQVESYLSSLGWGFDDARISLEVATQGGFGMQFNITNASFSTNGNQINPFGSYGNAQQNSAVAVNVYSLSPEIQMIASPSSREVITR